MIATSQGQQVIQTANGQQIIVQNMQNAAGAEPSIINLTKKYYIGWEPA